jgi:hypothetical protein
VNGLQQEFGTAIEFVSLDANKEGAEAFSQLTLRGHPAVVIFDASGKETYRTFGLVEEAPIRDALEQLSGS